VLELALLVVALIANRHLWEIFTRLGQEELSGNDVIPSYAGAQRAVDAELAFETLAAHGGSV